MEEPLLQMEWMYLHSKKVYQLSISYPISIFSDASKKAYGESYISELSTTSVSIILELFPSIIWRHMSTNQSPADHCSRGLFPQKLKTCKLWWNGPEWLLLSPKQWLKSKPISFKNMPEVKSVVLSVAPVVEPVFTLWNRYSSLNKLIHVVAYCLRFMISLKFPSYGTLPKPIKLLNLIEMVSSASSGPSRVPPWGQNHRPFLGQ